MKAPQWPCLNFSAGLSYVDVDGGPPRATQRSKMLARLQAPTHPLLSNLPPASETESRMQSPANGCHKCHAMRAISTCLPMSSSQGAFSPLLRSTGFNTLMRQRSCVKSQGCSSLAHLIILARLATSLTSHYMNCSLREVSYNSDIHP